MNYANDRKVQGVAIGIVQDFNDPRGEGRIRVKYPWMQGAPLSNYAAVAAPMAGASRGAFFMPEPGDEVLLAFDHGDMDIPYVVGFLWNGPDKPPEKDRKNRVIVTPGGHTIRFEDGDNKKLVIRSSSGHEILLDDASGNEISIKSQGGLSIVLDDNAQSITLRGGGRSLALAGGQVQIA
jgi:uncharacterized protein involved in type VI secretion and phage assembly